MTIFNKLKLGLAGLGFVGVMAFAVSTANAAQPPCFQYNTSGNFTTSATPVYNDICGDPTQIPSAQGPVTLGDESNFVRIRQDVSGDDTNYSANDALTTGTLNNACVTGSKFDVWTYIHNNAYTQDNDNGSGSAVAINPQLNISAPNLNTTNSSFPFTSTISANNAAATVNDTATLNCDGQQVKLTLVPGSVHYTLDVASSGPWVSIPDTTVGSTTNIGNPTWPVPGQEGYQWGCYNYRIVVVYQVTTQVIPPKVPPVCLALNIDKKSEGESLIVDSVNSQANDYNITGVSINFGDKTPAVEFPPATFPYTHTYSTPGNYTVTATVLSTYGNVTSKTCTAVITATSTPTPIVTTTPPTPAITELANTGPGSVLGIFAGTALLAGVGRHLYKTRRLTNFFKNSK